MQTVGENQELIESRQLGENKFVRILSEANPEMLKKLLEFLEDKREVDLENQVDSQDLVISIKKGHKVARFVNKIKENINFFFSKLPENEFLDKFYKDLAVASSRASSLEKLRPEERMELSAEAYCGFTRESLQISQENFAPILFVLALASFANQKSGQEVNPEMFQLALVAMQDRETMLKTSTLSYLNFNKYQNKLSKANLLLNSIVIGCEIVNFFQIGISKNKSNEKPLLIPMYFLGIAESISNLINNSKFNNVNTNLLFLTTSLFFALESVLETVKGRNEIKTFYNIDEPVSLDNRFLFRVLSGGLFLASQFDRRFGVDRISSRFVRGLSSLYRGAINISGCIKKTQHSQDASIESLPNVPQDKVNKLAIELFELLYNYTPHPDANIGNAKANPVEQNSKIK